MKMSLAAIACGTLLSQAGCATKTGLESPHPQPGQRALIVFKITHQDRAGESGTAIRKTGEIVSVERGNVLIAGDEGDIIHCPAKELQPVTKEFVVMLAARKQKVPDWIAAEELERWFPADKVPFRLRWLPPQEIAKALRQARTP